MAPGPDAPARSRRATGPAAQLAIGFGILVLVAAAIVVGFLTLYKQFWGPGAFAERYVEKIAAADASGALAMPGVAPEYADLEQLGRGYASDTLLRAATLTSEITGIDAVSEQTTHEDGREITEVTVQYTMDGGTDRMVFRLERTGTSGLVPEWGFETSPLSVIDLTVRGSWRFSVNGYEIDKRQVSPAGVEADPLEPVSLLAFSPGNYAVSVDTAATAAPSRSVRAKSLLGIVPVDIQTRPTTELNEVVQEKIEDYLVDTCTTQTVLQPSGCPFGAPAEVSAQGFAQSDIVWEMVDMPRTALVPDGDDWEVSATSGMAKLSVTIQDYYTGALVPVEREVFFTMVADVDVRDDNSVEITIDSAGDEG